MLTSVIIDSREPSNVQALTFYGAKKGISCLPYGDLWATCEDGATMAIERKTPNDFIGSMTDSRLLEQARGLATYRERHGWWCYVMITGELSVAPGGFTYAGDRATRVTWQAVQGEILNLQEMGIYVTFAASEDDYEQAVIRLSNRNHAVDHKIMPPKRKGVKLSPGAEVLASLPGIGVEMSEQIMTHSGSAAKAIEMLTTGQFIPRVGAKTREKIAQTLGLNENEGMGVFRNE